MMHPKTDVVISKESCRIGDNIFFLISTAYCALEKNGLANMAKEMQDKIDTDAKSPNDVLNIVKEYVTIR